MSFCRPFSTCSLSANGQLSENSLDSRSWFLDWPGVLALVGTLRQNPPYLRLKVLIDCHLPFSLAHGGMQVQIEETMRALNAIGVCVAPLRWWDENQEG